MFTPAPSNDSTRPGEPGRYLLRENWEISLTQMSPEISEDTLAANWSPVHVPGEPYLQGFPIEFDTPFFYRLRLDDYVSLPDTRQFLRFDGVYSAARVFINGVFAGQHLGGFTTWEVEIPEKLRESGVDHIVIEVVDRSDSIAAASKYAMHPIGGILRDVWFVTRSSSFIQYLTVEATPHLNDVHQASWGVVRIDALVSHQSVTSTLVGTLLDATGSVVERTGLSRESKRHTGNLFIDQPQLWSAENPELYTVVLEITDQDRIVDTVAKKVGFKKIEIRGTTMLVNGLPVFLRGINRHDIHPLWGRVGDADFDWVDARLLKNANVNYVRTSHYPPTESFLDAADEFGLYVEVESAVCFQKDSVDDPAREQEFLNQIDEMVLRDRHRACVTLWSAGNESSWGVNAATSVARIRELDATRPIKYSWDHLNLDAEVVLDVYSQHYPGGSEDPGSFLPPLFIRPEMFLQARNVDLEEFAATLKQHWVGFEYAQQKSPRPILNDEWAHIPAYDLEGLRRDPGRGNDWGGVISELAESAWASPDCLGGAVWATIDEIFQGVKGIIGYGPWGIADVWRREKPEFFQLRDAYSPISVNLGELALTSNGSLSLPIHNRYDHTTLSAHRFELEAGGTTYSLEGLNLSPRTWGTLVFRGPVDTPALASPLRLEAWDPSGRLIFSTGRIELVSGTSQGKVSQSDHTAERNALANSRADSRFSVVGNRIVFDTKGVPVIDGPAQLVSTDFGFDGLELTPSLVLDNHVQLDGLFDGGSAQLTATYESHGLRLQYVISNTGTLPRPQDGPQEIGISLVLPDVKTVRWSEKRTRWGTSMWGEGEAQRSGTSSVYRRTPSGPWHADEMDFYLFGIDDSPGRGTRQFRALKRHVRWLELLTSSRRALMIIPESPLAVRLENSGGQYRLNDQSLELRFDSRWQHQTVSESGPGDFRGTRTTSQTPGAVVTFDFEGDGFRWVGPRPFRGGVASVTVDGQARGVVDLRSTFTALDSMTLFTVTGLGGGSHRARIEVDGDHPGEVGIDYIDILSSSDNAVRLLLLAEYGSARHRNITETVNDQTPLRILPNTVVGSFLLTLS